MGLFRRYEIVLKLFEDFKTHLFLASILDIPNSEKKQNKKKNDNEVTGTIDISNKVVEKQKELDEISTQIGVKQSKLAELDNEIIERKKYEETFQKRLESIINAKEKEKEEKEWKRFKWSLIVTTILGLIGIVISLFIK